MKLDITISVLFLCMIWNQYVSAVPDDFVGCINCPE